MTFTGNIFIPMPISLRNKIWIFSLLTGIYCSASAAPEITDADLLTCNIPADNSSFFLLDKRLQSVWTEKGDGEYFISGPMQSDGLCLRDIAITAAFGAMGVSAELCEMAPDSILDFIKARKSTLPQSSRPYPPGVIAFFEGKEESLTVFHGKASFPMKPDPKARQISYVCYKKLSGPQ